MSFQRWIYWSCLLSGWFAFFGWLLSELILGRWVQDSILAVVAMACGVAMAIGGALGLSGGLAQPQLAALLKRALPGLACGLLAGLLGSSIGSLFYALVSHRSVLLDILGRVIGWAVLGLCLGLAQGVYERSRRKLVNGLIGGLLGGCLAGLLFNPMSWLVDSPLSSRAFGFVILGLCLGLLNGLVQVVLKEAWLTVEKGFRPGRQLLLGQPLVTLGTSEKASLIFIAYGAKGVEPLHVNIRRQSNSSYLLQDNGSRQGTFLNGELLQEEVLLRDGDLIQIGPNTVRFRERLRPRSVAAADQVRHVPQVDAPQQRRPAVAPADAGAPAGMVASPPAPPGVTQQAKPSPVSAAPVLETARCPVCNRDNRGLVGKRRCNNCFNMY